MAKPCPQWLDDKRQPISVAGVKCDSNSAISSPIKPINSFYLLQYNKNIIGRSYLDSLPEIAKENF